LRLGIVATFFAAHAWIRAKNECRSICPRRDDEMNRETLRLTALVVLRESFSNLPHPGPHYRVVGSIVVRASSEHLTPDGALFERAIVPPLRLLDKILE
jgi:hypothetical protein